MRLFRPVGLQELKLIAASGFRAFPPRLPHQPIFYPVLTIEYAVKIARDWNTVDETSGYAGFVTAFDIRDDFVGRYPVREAGGAAHLELWVPAEEVDLFNSNLVGPIRVIESFVGAQCAEQIDPVAHLPISMLVPDHRS
jgi:hypothetical protein